MCWTASKKSHSAKRGGKTMRCLSLVPPCSVMAGQDEVWRHKGGLVSQRSGFPDVLKYGLGREVSGSLAGVSNLNSSVFCFFFSLSC